MELVLKDAQSALIVFEIIFGCDFNEVLVYQVVVVYVVGVCQGICVQKICVEVIGFGKKLWCQKGIGCVCFGFIKSLIWCFGGVIFVVCLQDYS